MTTLEIMQLAIESGKKGGKMSQHIDYLMNNLLLEFCKSESELKRIIEEILQMFPEQRMREYMLEFCINDICNAIDIHTDVLKTLLRKNLGCISCVVEESQTQEAE